MLKSIIRYAALTVTIGVMIMIFVFSAGTAEQSSNTSGKVTETVLTITVENYKELPIAEKQNIRQKAEPIIRKSAHFSEFAMLGLSLFVFFATFELKKFLYILLPSVVSVIYAATDEVHQIFVDGRGPGVIDVLIDTSGAVFAVVVAYVIFSLLCSSKHKKA